MHKLASSSICCADFSTPGGITNEVTIIKGSSRIGYEGFVRPQKGQGEAKLN